MSKKSSSARKEIKKKKQLEQRIKGPRYRMQIAMRNEGPFKGRVFVKKASMWLEYVCWNKENVADTFTWI